MLMIRFQRTGRTNDPAFRIVVLEKERAARAGNIVELLGTYNPKSKMFAINETQVKAWLEKGAQPTDSIRNLFINKGLLKGKKVNVLPKRTKKDVEVPPPTNQSGEVSLPAKSEESKEGAPSLSEESQLSQ